MSRLVTFSLEYQYTHWNSVWSSSYLKRVTTILLQMYMAKPKLWWCHRRALENNDDYWKLCQSQILQTVNIWFKKIMNNQARWFWIREKDEKFGKIYIMKDVHEVLCETKVKTWIISWNITLLVIHVILIDELETKVTMRLRFSYFFSEI